MTTPAAVRLPMWRRHDVRIAWAAGFVNNTGDWILLVALPLFVFVETRSGATTAFLFVAQLIAGAVLGPIGGTIVDRWDLRCSLIATNVLQAVAVLPLLTVTADRIWPAYVVMAAQSALNQVNNPANVALVPRVVAPDELTTANAAFAAAESMARLIGAPIGGLLVAWGGLAPVVILDAASFAVVAAAIAFLRSDTSPRPQPISSRSAREGLRVVRAHATLGPVIAIQSFAQIAQGAFVIVFVVFVVDTLGDDGRGMGVIRGTMAVGALVGSAIISRFARRSRSTALFAGGLLGMGIVSLLFWNAPSVTTELWVYAVLFSCSGLPGAMLSVGLFTTLQANSPPHALGRVVGIMNAGESIGVTVGSIVAGLLVDRIPLRLVLDGQAAIYLVAGSLAVAVLVRRHGDRPPNGPEAATSDGADQGRTSMVAAGSPFGAESSCTGSGSSPARQRANAVTA